MQNIGIVDIGMGNIFSIAQAFKKQGAKVSLVHNSSALKNIDKLVLPGVGSFSQMMDTLNEKALRLSILDYVRTEKFVLGICLGMQLFFEESEESLIGKTKGLGVFSGVVKKIPIDSAMRYKIPNIGWRNITINRSSTLDGKFKDYCMNKKFYFMHSYAAESGHNFEELYSIVVGCYEIPSMLKSSNVVCTQFHPEKSGEAGLSLLKRFLEL